MKSKTLITIVSISLMFGTCCVNHNKNVIDDTIISYSYEPPITRKETIKGECELKAIEKLELGEYHAVFWDIDCDNRSDAMTISRYLGHEHLKDGKPEYHYKK